MALLELGPRYASINPAWQQLDVGLNKGRIDVNLMRKVATDLRPVVRSSRGAGVRCQVGIAARRGEVPVACWHATWTGPFSADREADRIRITSIKGPIWHLVVVAGLVSVAALFPLLRRARRRSGHHCRCGYDLTGNTSGVCPECGVRIP